MSSLGFKEEKGYVHSSEEEQPSIVATTNETSTNQKEDFI